MSQNSISLNKYISQSGYCSRREADKLIEQGRVLLNSTIAQKGNRVVPSDEVIVDGQRIKSKKKAVYLALNKPVGITSTTDTRDPDNIIDFIQYKERIFPIGRLDKSSSGLILLTNNGDAVNPILREENNHEKEYIVGVNKPITTDFIKKMRTGVPILGTKTKPAKVNQLKESLFRIVLTQGLNRQIRRMCEYLGYKVTSLKRVRIMHIKLGDLPNGNWRYLTEEEEQMLQQEIKSSKLKT